MVVWLLVVGREFHAFSNKSNYSRKFRFTRLLVKFRYLCTCISDDVILLHIITDLISV
jgi:hypothetical protein